MSFQEKILEGMKLFLVNTNLKKKQLKICSFGAKANVVESIGSVD